MLLKIAPHCGHCKRTLVNRRLLTTSPWKAISVTCPQKKVHKKRWVHGAGPSRYQANPSFMMTLSFPKAVTLMGLMVGSAFAAYANHDVCAKSLSPCTLLNATHAARSRPSGAPSSFWRYFTWWPTTRWREHIAPKCPQSCVSDDRLFVVFGFASSTGSACISSWRNGSAAAPWYDGACGACVRLRWALFLRILMLDSHLAVAHSRGVHRTVALARTRAHPPRRPCCGESRCETLLSLLAFIMFWLLVTFALDLCRTAMWPRSRNGNICARPSMRTLSCSRLLTAHFKVVVSQLKVLAITATVSSADDP